MQFRKIDFVAGLQFSSISRLQIRLLRRQHRANWIEHQAELESRPRSAISKRVEPLKCVNRLPKHTVATLAIAVFFQIARQRSDNLNLMLGQKFGQILEAIRHQDCQVAAIDDPTSKLASLFYQPTEIRVHLGCPTGNIQRRYLVSIKHFDHRLSNFSRHALAPIWPGIDVAVRASLIANFANIDL